MPLTLEAEWRKPSGASPEGATKPDGSRRSATRKITKVSGIGRKPSGPYFVAERREPSGGCVGISDENRVAWDDSANNYSKVSAIGR